MNMRLTIPLLLLAFVGLQAQYSNTVGVIQQEMGATYEGYNLIFPHNQSDVYLLDNCGELVHQWEGEEGDRPGNSVYLLENGDLVRCTRKSSSGPTNPIWAGGAGETVEVRNWESDVLYSFTLSDSLRRLHHDIEPLPNGNILMIAWANKNYETAVAAGRDTALMSQDKVWSEVILEWNPETNEIVWEWDVWDHLVQNYDATKVNFGEPRNNPNLIDLNYDNHEGHPDWLHINAIDYNPVLNQIALSVPHFNEIWIIPHTETSEEAASEAGDLLYRWGNPVAYDQEGEQQLFFQHDVQWITPEAQIGDEDFGKISVFNNRLPDGTSSGNIISTTANGVYELANGSFTPTTFEQTVVYPEREVRAYSAGLSSTQFLPNGNALLMSGRWGFAYEMNPDGEVIWEYIVPMKAGRSVAQGEILEIGNNVTFRMTRYGLDYPAFEGKDLSPMGYLELNPNEGFCGIVNTSNVSKEVAFHFYPNPTTDLLTIDARSATTVRIHNIQGQLMYENRLSVGQHSIVVSHWQSGLYFVSDGQGNVMKMIIN